MENPLNEKEKKFLRFVFTQHKPRSQLKIAAGFFLGIGVFLSISGILMHDQGLFRTAGMMFTLAIMFFLWIRRERKLVDIVKKIIDDRDLA